VAEGVDGDATAHRPRRRGEPQERILISGSTWRRRHQTSTARLAARPTASRTYQSSSQGSGQVRPRTVSPNGRRALSAHNPRRNSLYRKAPCFSISAQQQIQSIH